MEQPKTAGVILLGTGGQAPPHTTTFFETACEMEDPRTIHPLAFRTHAHALGKITLKGLLMGPLLDFFKVSDGLEGIWGPFIRPRKKPKLERFLGTPINP